jgi:hypothetical protein
MAVDFADLNADGHDEIFVADMLSRHHQGRLTQRNMIRGEQEPVTHITARPQVPRNTLHINRGDNSYAELAQIAGVEASEWTWAPVFLDVDLDGYPDLLVGNGFERDNINLDAIARIERAKAGARLSREEFLRLRAMFPRNATRNLAFRNLGNLQFEEVSEAWGFHSPTIAQGICLADLDNDGDLDLAVNNLNDPAALFQNEAEAPRLGVRLQGLSPNTHGIGARIRVYGGPVPVQSQEMMVGGRYLSSDDSLRVFAAGKATSRLRVQVDWRSGRRSVLEDVEPGAVCLVKESEAAVRESITPVRSAAWFEDQSAQLQHRHHDDAFDDFGRQPLLGKRFSQLGPGVAWVDLDGDGQDDLVIGAGRGGQMAVFRNEGGQKFSPFETMSARGIGTDDQTTVLGFSAGAATPELLVGLANYESGDSTASSVVQFSRGNTQPGEIVLPGQPFSVGPLALADVDLDGMLELFVGGRVVAGRYPEGARSMVVRQHANGWVKDDANSECLADVGLVSSARWTDLSGDGWADLALACEWGPLRLFRNNQGELKPWDPEIRFGAEHQNQGLTKLSQLTGWWNGIASGDFDGDARLDLIAANWGLNSRFEFYGPNPRRIYYGDYDQDGVLELIEAGFDASQRAFVPDRWVDFYARSMPFLLEKFPTHQSWAETDVETALGEWMAETEYVEAAYRQSIVLLNRQNHFEVLPLPHEAQLSPAFAICVADADGDGHEDAFLSQNFFGVDRSTSRYDAGRGLWLRGDGTGRFESVPGQTSGVMLYGEQRGAAVADYDRDGRVDLVVSQNNAETRLYRNRVARPGLRIRVEKNKNGAAAIGALVRLQFGQRWGAAREVHAGSGYWSQDSEVLVMAQPDSPTQAWVRWPGGKTTMKPVPRGASELTITQTAQ